MKYFCVFLCALVAVVCINGQGIPTKQCPTGEHSVVYCPRRAEPDCDNPSGNGEIAGACGIPDCFCDKDTVRDPNTGKCVPLHECTNNVAQCTE